MQIYSFRIPTSKEHKRTTNQTYQKTNNQTHKQTGTHNEKLRQHGFKARAAHRWAALPVTTFRHRRISANDRQQMLRCSGACCDSDPDSPTVPLVHQKFDDVHASLCPVTETKRTSPACPRREEDAHEQATFARGCLPGSSPKAWHSRTCSGGFPPL